MTVCAFRNQGLETLVGPHDRRKLLARAAHCKTLNALESIVFTLLAHHSVQESDVHAVVLGAAYARVLLGGGLRVNARAGRKQGAAPLHVGEEHASRTRS